LAAGAGAAIGGQGDAESPVRRQLVGPNAILQTDQALVEMHGRPFADAVFRLAGIGADRRHPAEMVDAVAVRKLNQAIRDSLPGSEAGFVMQRAGELTGHYILANRIPAKAMLLLEALPRAISPHPLMLAMRRHSWTFAGSSRVTVAHGWRRATISIFDNPIAFGPCAWHLAVFATLLGPLAGRSLSIAEETCCADRGNCCRFIVRW
jgi:divinyl protochlorophyllide a 8-vinyl-reductase